MSEMKKLKENGIDVDEKNPFENEEPSEEVSYTYDQIMEMVDDNNG